MDVPIFWHDLTTKYLSWYQQGSKLPYLKTPNFRSTLTNTNPFYHSNWQLTVHCNDWNIRQAWVIVHMSTQKKCSGIFFDWFQKPRHWFLGLFVLSLLDLGFTIGKHYQITAILLLLNQFTKTAWFPWTDVSKIIGESNFREFLSISNIY